MKTILLWDIDGTLLASGGAGMRALQVSLHQVFEIDGSLEGIDWAGRTDRYIARQIFAKFQLPATEQNFALLFDAYVTALPAELTRSGSVLPGVRSLLEAVAAHGGIAQGLLTGNLRRGAHTKLGHHGLWHYFAFGAFADDSEHRNDLGPHALRRATAHTGIRFPRENTWVIGDTPHDIACGRAIGARTLALATGHHSVAELGVHAPDALLPDLSDADAFWRIVGE